MEAPTVRPLAILPNGEAVRPGEVRQIVIEQAAAPAALEGQRFKVVVVLDAGERRVVATGIARDDATELGRRCAKAVNEALGFKA